MSGYIGTQPVPQATQHRETFTATAGQTSFATAGYTPQFLDVFLNGIHLLNPEDYTASNGSDVVLTTGAALDDVLEVISYSTYEVNSQNYTGGLTVDNSAATVLTVDRAGSDGSIIDVQKNGSTVASIGNAGSDAYFRKDSGAGVYCSGTAVLPFGAHSLGQASDRWSDLYLSGGVYLGGTGAANKLDDVEFGTWTPTYVPSGTDFSSITYNTVFTKGTYIKIGNTVIIRGYIRTEAITVGSASGGVRIGNLPFVSSAGISSITDIRSRGSCTGDNFASNAPITTDVNNGSAYMGLLRANTTGSSTSHSVVAAASDMHTGSGRNITTFTQVYVTDA